MKTSESIANLAMALSLAQGEITSAKKKSANPFFKSKYADLADITDSIRDPLAKNNLCFTQVVHLANFETKEHVLTTILMHKSGEYISGTAPIICAKPNDPQAFGSAITYIKRYSLQAMIGIAADEDDDGNAATIKEKKTPKKEIIRKVILDGVEMDDSKCHEIIDNKIDNIDTLEDLDDFNAWKEFNKDELMGYKERNSQLWKIYYEVIQEKLPKLRSINEV